MSKDFGCSERHVGFVGKEGLRSFCISLLSSSPALPYITFSVVPTQMFAG